MTDLNDPAIRQALHQAEQYLIRGDLAQAEMVCRKIVAAYSQQAKALHMLGFIALQQNRPEEGLELLNRSVAAQPNDAEAQFHLGNALVSTRQFDRALDLYQNLTRAHPNHARAWAWLGIALFETERFDQSLAAFQKAVQLDPNDAETHKNFARALLHVGHCAQSLLEAQRAIALRPNWHEPYLNLANVLKEIGQVDRAVAALRKGLALRPDWPSAHSNLTYALYFHPDYDPAAILQEHQRWNAAHAEPLKSFIAPHLNDRSSDRRLRIGYVAPDFKEHCQSFFTMPLLSNHDHENFEIFCYADVPRPDEMTKRLQSHADAWRSTVGLSDEKLAEVIRADRIDILVDLTMHMSNGRLFTFARKPAPVQVTWLGYPGTTGLEAIDYRLTDPYLDPPGASDAYYSEQSIRLPNSFWCYDPLTSEPLVNSLPANTNGWITFGCLNNFCKVNESILKLWAAIMRDVPNSRLILLCPQGDHRRDVFASLQGIAPQRVELLERRPRSEYLKLYHRMDLCLDTFPYNGHTTTLDAYWMGVPTISLYGSTAVSRAGFSQASNLGLTEFVAGSQQQFVQSAIDLANNRARLRELRATLRQRMEASPLMDAKGFAGDVENVYRQIWRRWCAAQ